MRQNPFKILWLISAFLTLTLGAVGIFLPVVPTTPFCFYPHFALPEGPNAFTAGFLERIYTKCIWTAL